MPHMSRSTLSGRAIRRLTRLSQARNRAVRDDALVHDFPLHDPVAHKRIVNHLYVQLFTSAGDETSLALDFWKAYRLLIENGSLNDLSLSNVDSGKFIRFVKETAGVSEPDGE